MISSYHPNENPDKWDFKKLSFDLAILAFMIFFSSMLVIYLLNPSYSFVNDYLSKLANENYGWIMDIAFIITGLLLLPVFLNIYVIFDEATKGETRKFLKIAVSSGILAQVGLILLGFFPNKPGLDFHSIIAGIFFFSLMFCILFLTILVDHIRVGTVFERMQRKVIWTLGFALVLLDAIMIIFNLIPMEIKYTALIQKIVVLSSFLYLGYYITEIRTCYLLNSQ